MLIITKLKMPRPKKNRRICCEPSAYFFKPRGVPMFKLSEIVIEHDELESLRGQKRIYFSEREYAGGIIDGIKHYDFLNGDGVN